MLQLTLKLLFVAAARPLLEEDDRGELARKAMRRTPTANILGDVNEVSETFESCSVMLILPLSIDSFSLWVWFALLGDAFGLTLRPRLRPFQGSEAPLLPF